MADDAALAALRSELLLQLGEMRGDIRLILQSIEHQAGRAEEHRAALVTLDGRVDEVERTTVTRAEMADEVAKLRREMAEQRKRDAEQARRALMVWAIVVAVVGAALSAGVSIIAIVAN